MNDMPSVWYRGPLTGISPCPPFCGPDQNLNLSRCIRRGFLSCGRSPVTIQRILYSLDGRRVVLNHFHDAACWKNGESLRFI
jgi:hypothetical protein